MPIYEYEPKDRECLLCPGRFSALQSLSEAPLEVCPTCGLEVRRVISRVSMVMGMGNLIETAGKNGFTAYRKAERGVYERVAGQEGPEVFSKEQVDKLSDTDLG